MNLLDALLLLAVAAAAWSGYRQGLVVGILSLAGFLGGAAVGVWLAPQIVQRWHGGLTQAGVAIAIVLALATLAQVLLSRLGLWLRARFRYRLVHTIDAGLGSVASVVAVLVMTWLLASALRAGPVPALSAEIRDSRLVQAIDRTMPGQADVWLGSFRELVGRRDFPQVFNSIAAETIVPVQAPNPAEAGTAGVRRAAASIVKITGDAPSCSRSIEGSGFVFAPHRVMTNAHVVAGVRTPRVRVGGVGRSYPATVVLFDPGRDVAVLFVPGLDARALSFSTRGSRGDSAVVAGFPLDGPYRLDPARIRGIVTAHGSDIYGRRQVAREIFSLYAQVRPGNSGGPLLATSGQVYGVVFAESIDDPNTGYALTATEVATDAAQGRSATAAVGTGRCTR